MSAATPRMSPGRLLAWAALAGMLAFTLLPLLVVLKTALVPNATLFEQSATLWPHGATLDNFRRVLGLLSPEQGIALGGSGADVNFGRALMNSVVFTGVIVVMQTLCAAMAAYAFARLRFPGQRSLFGLFIASMMVPGVVTLIPNFVLLKQLGGLNTMAGMVAPFCLMQGFSVFFLRQFFLSIPRDIEEAALMDGASHFYVFWRIVLPLSTTALATVAMLIGINMWNEFFWPYLVGRDESLQVLPVALQTFKTQTPQGQPDWTGLMAAATVALLPTVALMLAFGRRVVESVQYSGGK